MSEYNALIDAMRILDGAKAAVYEATSYMITPASRMLMHAMDSLKMQAETALRGKENL